MSASRRCLCCVKYLMFVFNLIFWLGGCGLFGVGVWLSFTQSEFSSLPLSFPSLSAANLLLVAGGVTMVTGFLGCLGALKEQRCLLMTFFVILLLLVLTEVTLTLVLHIFHNEFKCCGVTSKTDWYLVINGTLPYSCCSGGMDQCVEEWTEPCYQKARQWLLDNILSVLVFGVCIGIVQILALIFSLLMYCQILRAEKYLD
ncbi:tetraspanin-4-like isoform X2 [Salvelinus namaycush]|uniref:Tetraspanin n=1 Tax=Salvelinus namaycush TaxID=8040 RepID=A0A8U0R6F6_SALNM|nr:tetraspanin-4-like isoform X2 [Salvelinus namaycush]